MAGLHAIPRDDTFYENLPPLVPRGATEEDRERIIDEIVDAWLMPVAVERLESGSTPVAGGVTLSLVAFRDAERDEAIDLGLIVERFLERIEEVVDGHDELPVRVVSVRGCRIDACDFATADLASKNVRFQSFGCRFPVIRATFRNAVFGDGATFSRARFGMRVDFQGAAFGNQADFRHAAFRHTDFDADTDFSSTVFGAEANFRQPTFGTGTDFSDSAFGDGAVFHSADFGAGADFSHAGFGVRADFGGANFGHRAAFFEAAFADNAEFGGAVFGNGVSFMNAVFGVRAGFHVATFGDDATFRNCILGDGAFFNDVAFGAAAVFIGAVFGDRADFTFASFDGGADFANAAFGDESVFFRASFSDGANFEFATICRSRLSQTKIDRGNLRIRDGQARVLLDALLPFYALPYILDQTRIRDTNFHSRARDPWSVLRRNYTGSNMVFILLFTLLAFLPVAAKSVFWSGVSKLQEHAAPVMLQAVREIHDAVSDSRDLVQAGWLDEANSMLREIDVASLSLDDIGRIYGVFVDGQSIFASLQQSESLGDAQKHQLDEVEDWVQQGRAAARLIAPDGEFRLERRRVVALVLGTKDGWLMVFLSALLIGYNLVRAFLTYQVGPLRDHTDQVGVSPAWDEYRYLWRFHRFISPILGIAIVFGLYRIAHSLWLPVLVPG